MALPHLLSLKHLNSVAILSDSRCTLQLVKTVDSNAPSVREVTSICRTLEGGGCTIYLQWGLSHSGISGSGTVDGLAAVAHSDDGASIFIEGLIKTYHPSTQTRESREVPLRHLCRRCASLGVSAALVTPRN